MDKVASVGNSGNLAAATNLMGVLATAKGQADVGAGAQQAGAGAQQAANYAAAQMDYNAGQEQASAQRTAEEARRQARLNVSRALAVAGASGGSAMDPTVLNIMANLNAEGQLQSLSAMYEGDSRANAMRRQAEATRYEGAAQAYAGAQQATAARNKAGTTLLSEAKGVFDSFNFGTDTKSKKQTADFVMPTGNTGGYVGLSAPGGGIY